VHWLWKIALGVGVSLGFSGKAAAQHFGRHLANALVRIGDCGELQGLMLGGGKIDRALAVLKRAFCAHTSYFPSAMAGKKYSPFGPYRRSS